MVLKDLFNRRLNAFSGLQASCCMHVPAFLIVEQQCYVWHVVSGLQRFAFGRGDVC